MIKTNELITTTPGPPLAYLLSGFPNSQLKESMSRQNASLSSSGVAFLASIEDKRLLDKVTFGEAERVALSGLEGSSISTSVTFLSPRLSRVLFTASRTTDDGFES